MKQRFKTGFQHLVRDWKNNKKKIQETINGFNSDVFANFDLSAIRGEK